MHREYGDRVAFVFVYIREAHPEDEWQLEDNRGEGVVVSQPTSLVARRSAANQCSAALSLSMPCVVDDMNNSVDEAYAGWPERLFVVDVAGRVAFAGSQGPFGFEPDQVRNWLRKNVEKAR